MVVLSEDIDKLGQLIDILSANCLLAYTLKKR